MKQFTLFLFVLFFFQACDSADSVASGLSDDKFSKCPDSPNCVVSFYKEDSEHFIDPIKYQASKEEIYQRFKAHLENRKDAYLVKESEDKNYLHYEFKSRIFGFIDDVEFYFAEPGIIHIRSASRVGHSDWGKNRSRMEELRFQFYQNEF